MTYQSLQSFFHTGKQISYKKNEIIIRPEEIPQGIYYLESGYIKAYTLTENGHEHLYMLFKPGEFFPVRWIFVDNHTKNYFQATTDVTLYRVTKESFLGNVNANPELATAVDKYLINILDLLLSRVDTLEYTNARLRLVTRLLFLAERFGVQENGTIIFTAPITHQDIANSTNMTRETVSREITNLEKKGIIGNKSQKIIIYDIKLLQKELTTDGEKTYL